MLAIVTLYVPKLVMIPVSLATAFGLTLIPTITESFTSRNYKLLNQQINQTMQIILFLVIPAVVGMSVLSVRPIRSSTALKVFARISDRIYCSGTRLSRFCFLCLP
nr:hypothetical protein P5660_09960 [Bacillus velezensis]